MQEKKYLKETVRNRTIQPEKQLVCTVEELQETRILKFWKKHMKDYILLRKYLHNRKSWWKHVKAQKHLYTWLSVNLNPNTD